MQLTKASSQWASRPADQRFWTVQDLYNATKAHHEAARTASLDLKALEVKASDNGGIVVKGITGKVAELTHWAFGQLCARIGAPAGYLRTLTPDLAVKNINEGLGKNSQEPAKALLHENGGYYCRAITSDKYTRIWNDDIVSRLLTMESDGWKVPPAYPNNAPDGSTRIATAEDAKLSLTIHEGDVIGPSGLYASFEDMFVFMINPERIIRDGSSEGLMRGFFIWNSEVGKSTFGISTFLFRGVCGNHICWDVSENEELKLRHIGNADERAFDGLQAEIVKYANESADDVEAKIEAARTFVLKGKTKEETVDFIFSHRFLTKRDANAAYDAVIPEQDGDPFTAWGFAQGVTRLSQLATNADDRLALDRVAGKILDITF